MPGLAARPRRVRITAWINGRIPARVTALLAAVAMCAVGLALGPVGPASAAVTNTFSGTAAAVGSNWHTHTFSVPNPGYRTITLNWDNASADLNLGLRNPAGTFVKWASSTSARPEVITYTLDVSGTWAVAVSAKSGPSTNYTITVDDAPATTCSATFCGAVSATGTTFRVHTFSVPTAGTINASLDWDDPSANLNLGLRDPSGTWVKWASSTTAKPELITYAATTTGTWAIGVSAKAGGANYAATVTETQGGQPSVGDRVWRDANGDGIQQPAEPGLPGATVHLLTTAGAEITSTVSGADGSYTFLVPSGSYRIAVDLPVGFSYSPQHQGTNLSLDSDVSLRSARSDTFTVAAGQALTSIDAGAVPTGAVTKAGALDAAGTAAASLPIPVASPGTISVVLDWDEAPTADLNVALIDPSGQQVAIASTAARPEALSFDATTIGYWTVTATAVTGAARFVLDVRQSPLRVGAPPVPTYLRTIGGSARAQIYPSGLDVDSIGNVYVADTGNDTVAAYGPDGSQLWVSGSRGRAPGQFSEPRDVAYLNGKIYVADTGNNRIQVLDAATGAVLTVWSTVYGAILGVTAGVDGAGNPVILGTEAKDVYSSIHVHDPATGVVLRTIGAGYGTGSGQLNEPRDAATDSAGTIFVADFRNHRIAKFSSTGAWLGSFGSLGSLPGQFNAPYGVALDQTGRIYVADANNARVQEFTHDGAYLKQFGSAGTGPGQFFQLRRAVAGAGTSPLVYAADLWGDKITAYNQDGTVARVFGNIPAPAGGFNKPYGLALVGGDVYVADTTNQRIERFSHAGGYLDQFGGRGFGETVNGLNWPRDVTYAPATNTLWVADTKNQRLVEYGLNYVATGRKLGTLGSGDGQFNRPDAIAPIGADLIVADLFNNRVQRVSPSATGDPVVWSVSGVLGPRDIAVAGDVVWVTDTVNRRILKLRASDGAILGTITNTQLYDPEGIAVSPTGELWVTDSVTNRLLEFSAAGALEQIYGASVGQGTFHTPGKLEIQLYNGVLELYVVDTLADRVEVYQIG